MAFSDETSYTGQQNISTFNGNILIDNARGEIAIRETGNPAKRTVLDKLGLTTIRADGTGANRVGQAKSDLRDGMWSMSPGESLEDYDI